MSVRRISSECFKNLLSTQGPSAVSDPSIVIVRAGPSALAEVSGARRLLWKISTPAVDRMGDIIDQSGWDLANFNAGGSVLWAHDPTLLPVAKPIKTYVEGDALWSLAEYPEADVSEFADTVFKLCKGGFLRGASVGMRPISYACDEMRRSDEHPYPIRFTKQELLEWSHTPIPANPEALLQAKSLGIELRSVRTWAERVLDTNSDIVGIGRGEIEAAYRAASETSAVVSVPAATTKSEDEEDPALNPAADPETLRADKCNAMLREILALSSLFMACADEGDLDTEALASLRALCDTCLALQSAEQAEEAAEIESGEAVDPTGAAPSKALSDEELIEAIRAACKEAFTRRP